MYLKQVIEDIMFEVQIIWIGEYNNIKKGKILQQNM